MKNVEKLYKKHYNAYKNYYDNDDELTEAKEKQFNYKQFELFDKTDKKLTLDEETKKFFEEIEYREKNFDKRGFIKHFNYEPITSVNKLLGQNTQDFRKSLDEIKQQTIELSKDERNSTNNKTENYRLNSILSVTDRIYQFFKYEFLSDKQPTQVKTEPLPDTGGSNIKQPTHLKNLNSNEIPKPLWTKIPINDFISLVKGLVDK